MSDSGVPEGFGRWKEGLEVLTRQLGLHLEATTRDVIDRSVDRGAMALAYAALDGRVSGDIGRRAFRRALLADGIPGDMIDHLDALYTRCLLDPTLADELN